MKKFYLAGLFLLVAAVPLFSWAQESGCFVFSRDLAQGSQGEDVSRLQQILIDVGELDMTAPTGYFDSVTKTALRMWQRSRGISYTGTLGPITRDALNKRCNTPTNSSEAVCGAASYIAYNIPPANKLCLLGTPSNVTKSPLGAENYWTCTGVSGGRKSCVGPFSVTGEIPAIATCGEANSDAATAYRPEDKLCQNGTPTLPALQSGKWVWNCTGGNGNHQRCSAPYGSIKNTQISIVSFKADPVSVTVGGRTNFSFKVQNGTKGEEVGACRITGQNGYASAPLSWLSSSSFPSPTLTTVGPQKFTLTCYLAGITKTKDVNVAVIRANANDPAIDTFTVSPASITLGQSVSLVWKASADTCAFSGEFSTGVTAASYSSLPQIPSSVGTKTYILTCTKGGKSVSQTRTVTVLPAPVSGTPTARIIGVTTNPFSGYRPGTPVGVSWTVQNVPKVVVIWTKLNPMGGAEKSGWVTNPELTTKNGHVVNSGVTAGGVQWLIPADAENGTYVIQVFAASDAYTSAEDSGARTPEMKSAPFSVQGVSLSPAKLEVQDIFMSPSTAAAGTAVSFYAYVRNTGGTAANNVTVKWFRDGALVATKVIPSVAANSGYLNRPETTISLKPTAGHHTVMVQVFDQENEIEKTFGFDIGSVSAGKNGTQMGSVLNAVSKVLNFWR
jgi:hypothetical protein